MCTVKAQVVDGRMHDECYTATIQRKQEELLEQMKGMYTVKTQVLDENGNEIFSVTLEQVAKDEIILPGYATPGLQSVARVLAHATDSKCSTKTEA